MQEKLESENFPAKLEEGEGEKEEEQYLEFLRNLPPDIMKERAEIMIGTLNATLDNIENLRWHVLNKDMTPQEALKIRRPDKKIVEQHYYAIKAMLETGKIRLEDVINFLGAEKQKRIKEMFEVGLLNFLVINRLN